MNNKNLTIHQLLHGYENGHSLLSSSVELDSDVKRTILIMSDLSGQNFRPGFEEYITGYPLTELSLYAIARTWYAFEMERPGCVWTHTLLISFSDLAKISNPRTILNKFRRPHSASFNKENSYNYELILEVDEEFDHSLPVINIDSLSLITIESIIEALYSSDKPTLVQAAPSSSLDYFITSLWLQQWPRLRRNFSFCTGAIDLRLLHQKPLDLQVIPNNLRLKHEVNLVAENTSLPKVYSSWVSYTFDDLVRPTLLRTFLKDFGADVSIERESFKTLVELYLLMLESPKVTYREILEQVASKFPSPKEAVSLKNILVYNRNNRKDYFHLYTEKEILLGLITSKTNEALSIAQLDFKIRIESLYSRDSNSILDTLNNQISGDSNSYTIEALNIVAAIISDDDLLNISSKYKNLAYVFLTLNPSLAYSAKLWIENRHNHRSLISALLNSNYEDKNIDWKKLISIFILNQIEVEPVVFKNKKINLCSIILDIANTSPKIHLDYKWLSFLSKDHKPIIKWLVGKPYYSEYLIETVLIILNPNSTVVEASGSEIWCNMLEKSDVRNQQTILKLQSFCLCVAFNVKDKKSCDLIVRCFESVYDALAKDQLDFQSWRELEVHTKPLVFWKDWDRCKKIVIALAEKLKMRNILPAQIEKGFQNRETLKRVTKYYKKI